MLTLSAKIEFVKFMNEKLMGRNLEGVEVTSVIDCTVDVGIVENIDVADDKVSVWGSEGRVFWINLNDVMAVNYNPRERGLSFVIEAKNNVEIRFKAV